MTQFDPAKSLSTRTSAIAEGATWVRIGTALFGARDYGSPSL